MRRPNPYISSVETTDKRPDLLTLVQAAGIAVPVDWNPRDRSPLAIVEDQHPEPPPALPGPTLGVRRTSRKGRFSREA